MVGEARGIFREAEGEEEAELENRGEMAVKRGPGAGTAAVPGGREDTGTKGEK